MAVRAGALAGPAFAADVTIPRKAIVKAPPARPAVAALSPVGIYIGAHIGAGRSRLLSAAAIESLTARGALTGVQIGANVQTGNTVLGIEADLSGAWVRGSTTGTIGGVAATSDVRHRVFAAFAGRLGQSVGRSLFYRKAGGAWTRYRFDFAAAPNTRSESHNRFGWMLGAGIEQALTNGVSVRLEYNYMDLGRRTETFSNAGPPIVPPVDVRMNVHVVKLGLNYPPMGGR